MPENYIKDRDNAIKYLQKYLDELSIENSEGHKKISLLSYWMKDFCNYLRWEKTFNPTSLKRYERGDIIKVNLGYNVGSEEGGLHYAVVADMTNALSSPVITIIPLTSVKDISRDIRDKEVFLGDEIYQKLKVKSETLETKISEGISVYKARLDEHDRAYKMVDEIVFEILTSTHTSEETKNRIEDLTIQIMEDKEFLEKQISVNEKQAILLTKVKKEIEKMKQGSIALVGQISTISKLRIYDPKNAYNVLSGIKLSAEELNKINEKIKQLYVYK